MDAQSPFSGEVAEEEEEEEDNEDDDTEDEGVQENSVQEPWERRAEERAAAEELLRASQMRIECVKVCAPAQLQELVEGGHSALARVRGVKQNGLRRLHPVAVAEHTALLTQWQQRSGTIRVVVRVRPMFAPGIPDSAEQEEPAVKVLPGASQHRGITVAIPRRGRLGADVHNFKRLDYVLSSEKGQEAVFHELRAMLPSASPGGLAGPPQSACILAYGQTGSGKTHTMHGGTGEQQGLVPRVLFEVFQLAGASGATVSLSAVEIYNDIAYDLLDGATSSAGEAANDNPGRAFSAGRVPPPPGLNFRHGCQCALEQATSVDVQEMEEAEALLLQAAERRSTRSTCFNATSSRSHSLVFVHANLPGTRSEPALRLAFVDLAGSERLPAEAGGAVADESRHINLSLSALGSVIHALRHRANHLPYRTCLLTRLLEPFFKASGRVLLCVCISPERRHAQETLCSMAFADRASRATLGAESAQEVQRGQALAAVRDLHAVLRMVIRDLLPQSGIGMQNTTRLPDWLAAEVLAYMPEHGEAMFVCRTWAELCLSTKWWGRVFRRSQKLATSVLQFLSSKMEAAGVCKTWWKATGAFRVTMEAASVKVLEAAAGAAASGRRVWTAAGAKTRSDMWKAFLAAGGGSEVASQPLALVRECTVAGAPKPEALRQVLRRCFELRLVEVPDPGLISSVCAGLVSCTKLRALKLGLTLVPNMVNLRQVLQSCKQLRVLHLSNGADFPVSLQYLTEELPKSCTLRELTVVRCTATWKDIEILCKSCRRLQTLKLPQSFVEVGGALSPPPLVPLARLRLRSVDFQVHQGRAHKNRSWLTDDMFGIVAQMRNLQDVRADGQKLLSDRCFWFLRRHHFCLRRLHLSGCRPMCGESAFGLLHLCESLESVRLPTLILGQSERRLGVIGANRWCQGLRSPRLRELCVDGWPSLEDPGVQMLVAHCPQLRTLWLRQAARLSDDAVTYAAGLEKLTSLSFAFAAGLTDRALQELSVESRLRCLDLSGCRQLTEGAVVEFASKMASAVGPQLQFFQLETCPNLGRAAAEALVACGPLLRCSLNSCRTGSSEGQEQEVKWPNGYYSPSTSEWESWHVGSDAGNIQGNRGPVIGMNANGEGPLHVQAAQEDGESWWADEPPKEYAESQGVSPLVIGGLCILGCCVPIVCFFARKNPRKDGGEDRRTGWAIGHGFDGSVDDEEKGQRNLSKFSARTWTSQFSEETTDTGGSSPSDSFGLGSKEPKVYPEPAHPDLEDFRASRGDWRNPRSHGPRPEGPRDAARDWQVPHVPGQPNCWYQKQEEERQRRQREKEEQRKTHREQTRAEQDAWQQDWIKNKREQDKIDKERKRQEEDNKRQQQEKETAQKQQEEAERQRKRQEEDIWKKKEEELHRKAQKEAEAERAERVERQKRDQQRKQQEARQREKEAQQRRAAEQQREAQRKKQREAHAKQQKKDSSGEETRGGFFGRWGRARSEPPKETRQKADAGHQWTKWPGASPPSESKEDKARKAKENAERIAKERQQEAAEKKATSLMDSVMKQIDGTRNAPLEERKKVFKDLQRQLHPDKNPQDQEAAKLAFQKLMENRNVYLS